MYQYFCVLCFALYQYTSLQILLKAQQEQVNFYF